MNQIYLIVTERDYGEEMKLFRLKDDAKDYQTGLRIDSIMLDFEISPEINKCFVVVSEQWYGGGEEYIKLFIDKLSAKEYKRKLETFKNLDVIIKQLSVF